MQATAEVIADCTVIRAGLDVLLAQAVVYILYRSTRRAEPFLQGYGVQRRSETFPMVLPSTLTTHHHAALAIAPGTRSANYSEHRHKSIVGSYASSCLRDSTESLSHRDSSDKPSVPGNA
jgi:hypothetical protein